MKSVQFQAQMLSNAQTNLEQYINSLKWLEPIYKTCKEWTSKLLNSFKDLPPPDIEVIIINYKLKVQEIKFTDYLC